jgi:hypothetical protein
MREYRSDGEGREHEGKEQVLDEGTASQVPARALWGRSEFEAESGAASSLRREC